jgi:hypothetical protein
MLHGSLSPGLPQCMKIIYHGELSDNLRHLVALAKCLGVDSECVNVPDHDSLRGAIENQGGIVLDVASLQHQYNQDELECLKAELAKSKLALLLFSTELNRSTNVFLQTLTANAVQAVKPVIDARRVFFPATANEVVSELSSHSYPKAAGEAQGLVVDSRSDIDVLMNLDNTPSFVRTRVGTARVFVWCTPRVFDVQKPLTAEKQFEEAADQYIPVIAFLRFAFRGQCWHNPSVGAGLIIDDPLPRKKYGFIRFPLLLESARKGKYHVTLAFIPWNCWRSRASDVKLFLNYSDCFSLCAHGCDHTNKEFRSIDYQSLLAKNFAASRRMLQYRQRTGLATESLMVCPQEEYSLEAMRAFADSRQFLGLACTACMPRNLSTPQIRGADLLLPAQDSFYGFPVFKRHYWKGMAAFAMALFLGKPAILVEHHEFFRNGSAGAEEFARRLAEIRPDLKWRSLEETVTRTHVRRPVSKNKEEVRFFTDIFYLEHELEQPAEFRLFRRLPETTRVERVRVSGKEVPFTRTDGFLTFDTRAQNPETLTVQVDVAPVKPTKSYSLGIKYQASVALRRGLSELRDNVIVRHPLILKAGSRLMKSLKQTAS